MTLRAILRHLAPPILADLYSRATKRQRGPRYIWEGIYRHYRDVPLSGEGIGSKRWADFTRASTVQILTASKSHGTVPADTFGHRALLPLLAALLCRESRRITILDFGGGMGVDYISLVSSLMECDGIEYHMVETGAMVEGGAQLFAGDLRIRFHRSLPSGLPALDIIYINSVLQLHRGLRRPAEAPVWAGLSIHPLRPTVGGGHPHLRHSPKEHARDDATVLVPQRE